MKVFNFNSKSKDCEAIRDVELVDDYRVADIIFCSPFSKIEVSIDQDYKSAVLKSEDFKKMAKILDDVKPNQLIILNGRYNLYFYMKYVSIDDIRDTHIGNSTSTLTIANKAIVQTVKKEINVPQPKDVFFYYRNFDSDKGPKIKNIVTDKRCSTINYLSCHKNFILTNVDYGLMLRVPGQFYLDVFNKLISKQYEKDC